MCWRLSYKQTSNSVSFRPVFQSWWSLHILAEKGQRRAEQSGIRPRRSALELFMNSGKAKQTEKETAGSKAPRITASLPSRTHSRPQKPPALLTALTQWKHHRQPSRRRRQRQNKQRWEPPTASQLEQSSQRDNDKEICFILHLVLFISCTNDCETRWNRFHIRPQSDGVSVSHKRRSTIVPTLSARENDARVALSSSALDTPDHRRHIRPSSRHLRRF